MRLNADGGYNKRVKQLTGRTSEDDISLSLLLAFADAIRDSAPQAELASWTVSSENALPRL